jgi:pyruvate oxidase
MAKAVALIDRSKNPVIVAGWGAHETALDLNNLAKKIKAPIVTTYRAKGILPESNEWVMGLLGTTGSAQARSLVSESDLLITLGVGFSKMTGVPVDKPMIQVDLDPKKLGRVPFTVALWGNCNLVVPRLLGSVKEKNDPLVLPHLATLKKEWDDQREKEADPNAVPIRPPYIIRMLEETIPEDAVISVDIGENMWWFGRNFRMKRQKMVMSGYLGTMGTGLPGAIAAKVAYPEKTVVCITGDGGFSQSMADFVTTVKNDLPMVVVVMNNHQLAMIQVEQKMENYPNFGTDLLNPDFAGYAEICGGTGIKVDKPKDLKPALIKALEMNRPVIVDINTDPKRF